MPAKVVMVRFDADKMWVEFDDERILGVPLSWSPKLSAASKAERSEVKISALGLHWDRLDEDLSIEGLLAGRACRAQAIAEMPLSNELERRMASGTPFNYMGLEKYTPNQNYREADRAIQKWRRAGWIGFERQGGSTVWSLTAAGEAAAAAARKKLETPEPGIPGPGL